MRFAVDEDRGSVTRTGAILAKPVQSGLSASALMDKQKCATCARVSTPYRVGGLSWNGSSSSPMTTRRGASRPLAGSGQSTRYRLPCDGSADRRVVAGGVRVHLAEAGARAGCVGEAPGAAYNVDRLHIRV